MANESERPSAEPADGTVTELRIEWTLDVKNGLVMLSARHPLELPAAAKVVPIPFGFLKLMAGQVLTIEAQLQGLLTPQGQSPASSRRLM